MSTRTLILDDDLLAQAEAYAARTGTDLSGLVAQALRSLVQPPAAENAPAFDPIIMELLGCISLPANYDYRQAQADDFLARNK